MTKELNEAMAAALTDPSSGEILDLMREIRRDRVRHMASGNIAIAQNTSSFYSDCANLYKNALFLESDPEIVTRNTLARVLAGIGPFIQAFEEIRTLEDKDVWELMTDAGSIIAEIASASQYLESVKLTTQAHYKENLLEVEERMMEMAENSMDPLGSMARVSSIMDSISSLDIPSQSKPFIPFVLWMLLVIIDYRIYSLME